MARVGCLYATGYWPRDQNEFTCPYGPSLRLVFAGALTDFSLATSFYPVPCAGLLRQASTSARPSVS
jgi:hypothetical protein